MKAILVFQSGGIKICELGSSCPEPPKVVNIPLPGWGCLTFERSGTSADGEPVYGSLSDVEPPEDETVV
jgi:hypothetical protein